LNDLDHKLFSRQKIFLILVIIGIISLGFKIYLADFSIPVFSDALEYTQHSMAQSQGQFLQHPQRHSGWPLLQSPFMYMLNSNNFLDYSNTSKLLSIAMSSLTIIPLYLLSNRYLDPKFSLLVVGIFAFEPRLIQNSVLGFSESFFIFTMIFSIYFITRNEKKYIILSFILAGILWWIRPNGFILFPILTIIYFIKFKFSIISIRDFLFYFLIFIITVSPLLLQRYEQFGNPMYNWIGERIWFGDYSHSRSILPGEKYTAIDFINANGLQNFIQRFLFNGSVNLFSTLGYMMLPYLIILTPLGIIFSFKNKLSYSRLFPISIVLVVSIFISIVPFSVIPDKRLILFLFPFLMIFSVFTLKFYFQKFNFLHNNSKLFFILIFCILIITSSIMVSRYEQSTPMLENEQIDFTKYLLENFSGKLLFEPYNTQKYFNHPMIFENPEIFLGIKITENWKDGDTFFDYPQAQFSRISVYGTNMNELLENGEKVGLTHIMATSDGTSFFNFVNQLYFEDKQYPFLIKVYDSKDFNHKNFNVKVFEIDYLKYYSTQSIP
jgi:hypothetical protein